MKKLWIIVLIIFSTGCSVIMATQQPGRKDLSVLTKGVDRTKVIAELGSPLTTKEENGRKQDVFSFKQGYSKGSRVGRAIFHGIADVFTCGLWEIVGTPVEAIASGTQVKVAIFYDENDRVDRINTYGGKEKVDEGIVPRPEAPPEERIQ